MSSLFGGRRRLSLEDVNVDLIPIMSLFVCLIPLLVAEAVFYRVATLDVHLPPASATATEDVEPESEETGVQEILIDLGLEELVVHATLTHNPDGVAYDTYRDESTVVPFVEGAFDLELLSKTLLDLKARYSKHAKVILTISDAVLYDNIIQVMDTCRERIEEENGVRRSRTIFPDVALSEKFDETDTRLEGLRRGTKGLR